jgi:hypothetical protein
VAQKPNRTIEVQYVHNVSKTEAGLQNAVTTKLYVEMSRMSKQRKAEFVSDIFRIRSF